MNKLNILILLARSQQSVFMEGVNWSAELGKWYFITGVQYCDIDSSTGIATTAQKVS